MALAEKPLLRIIKNMDKESVETIPLFRKLHEEKKEGLGGNEKHVLRCFYIAGYKNWDKMEFANRQHIYKIGAGSNDIDIFLDNVKDAEPVQNVIRFVAGKWYILETGVRNLTMVNGFEKRQAVLAGNNSCILRIGNIPFIMTTNTVNMGSEQIAKDETQINYSLTNEGTTQYYPFSKTLLLGKNSFCDVRIEAGADFTGIIFNIGKDLYAVSTLHGGIKVDGKDADSPLPLKNDSVIETGKLKMTVGLPPESLLNKADFKIIDFPGAEMLFKEVTDDIEQENIFPVGSSGKITVGRTAANDLVLKSEKMSRHHAVITVYKNKLLLKDNESTNGTFVNGKKISTKMIHPGDIVEFGDRRFLLCFPED